MTKAWFKLALTHYLYIYQEVLALYVNVSLFYLPLQSKRTSS